MRAGQAKAGLAKAPVSQVLRSIEHGESHGTGPARASRVCGSDTSRRTDSPSERQVARCAVEGGSAKRKVRFWRDAVVSSTPDAAGAGDDPGGGGHLQAHPKFGSPVSASLIARLRPGLHSRRARVRTVCCRDETGGQDSAWSVWLPTRLHGPISNVQQCRVVHGMHSPARRLTLRTEGRTSCW